MTSPVVLRAWRDDDLEPFAALNADPVVMEHFAAPLSREQSDALVAGIRDHFAVHGYGLWAVEVAGDFAGFTGLSWTDVPGERCLEVGWRLARPFWGRGIAYDAARQALDVGLRQVPQVVSFTALSNERSWRLMERLGMRRVREFDHPRPDLPAGLRPHVLYATP